VILKLVIAKKILCITHTVEQKKIVIESTQRGWRISKRDSHSSTVP